MESKLIVLMTLLCTLFLPARATEDDKTDTPNARQARRIMETAYERVFGEQGSTLRYDVNIVGIYKTHGTIWMKGKKQRFVDERVDAFNDGTTAYMCYRKKKTVEIHAANSDKKDKHSGKFKFSLDDFNYQVAVDKDLLLLTMKQKKKAKGTIKEVKAWVKPGTYAPVKLRIKVAFFWTTIRISDFKSGGISDELFVFPAERYKDWKMVDKR